MKTITETWYAVTEDGYPHHIAYRNKAAAEAYCERAVREDSSIMVLAIDEIQITRELTPAVPLDI